MLDRLPLDQGDLDFSPLTSTLDELVCHDATAPDALDERLSGFEVAFTNKVVLGRQALSAADRLRLVCVMATGTDNVDLQAAAELGIAVSNCRGYATPAVTQHVFALITALATRWHDYQAAVRAGHWQRAGTFCLLDYPIRELSGATLGIVGYGDLGRAVAALGESFGMQVLISARPGERDGRSRRIPFAQLLPQVDVLSLHCPLTPATERLIDAAALAQMKPDAVLVNTARGGLVDSAALADALRAGRIGGAGIDVLDREPPGADHPLLAPDLPNLIVTPHSAWGSRQARQRLVAQLAENLRGFAQDRAVRP